MKARILIIVISFIFLSTIYSNTLYAVTDEIVEDTEVKFFGVQETLASPSGLVYIEAPTNQQIVSQADNNQIAIFGWAVSNQANATVRLVWDGNVVLSNLERTSRGDVDSIISPSYGGTSLTPNAGFYATFDTSQQSVGNHTLRIDEMINDTMIASQQINIQIAAPEYQGRVYIETPIEMQTFTKSEVNQIAIEGWAVSNDVGATLRIQLDGNLVNNSVARHSRGDVDSIISPLYGGTALTPNAGFHSTIDISGLSVGNHSVRVEELSRFGTIIASQEISFKITVPEYQGRVYIETPVEQQTFTKPYHNQIAVEGWAVSNDVDATLRVLLDGKIVNYTVERHSRGDVDSIISPSYGGTASTPNAGFRSVIDISNLSAGNHHLKIEELSKFGNLIASQEIVIKIMHQEYQGRVYVETPGDNQSFTKQGINQIKIEGWAVSNDAEAGMRVFLDGNMVDGMVQRISRGDVDSIISHAYGGTATTANAGFSCIVDMSRISTGNHILRVEEISKYETVIASQEISIQIANKQYQGKMYIGAPGNNQNFIKQEINQIKVEGWAVSNDAEAGIRVFLDGNMVNGMVQRTSRGDVDSIISHAYGGTATTANAGFSCIVDMSCIGTGKHTVRVEEISRYEDLICVAELVIYVGNKKYAGQMCIDMPTVNQEYTQGDRIAVGGWAVAEDENAMIEMYIDNVLKATADRYLREDVQSYNHKYGGRTTNAGFGKMIDTAQMSVGNHLLKVCQKSRYGDVISSLEVPFMIRTATNNHNPSTNTPTTPTQTPNNNSTANLTIQNTSGVKGIDVSQYQGNINWKSVADSGIGYSMIRIGYRGYGTGGFAEDTKFQQNFAGSIGNGIKTGVYFYSTAINMTEARKDAEYVVNVLKKYGYQNQVSMPIAIDLELIPGVKTRDRNVSKSMRTNIANTFCSTIAKYGYTPMIYACKSFLNDNMNASQIAYDVWVAQYNTKCTYNGKYTMWQYTSSGKVFGISGNVDCNICYKNY